MENDKILMMLQETSDKANRNEGRIKKLEEDNKAIHDLATSVAVMAEQMKGLNKNVTTLSGKVEEIESKPAKRWETIVEKVLLAVVAALVGLVLARLGL